MQDSELEGKLATLGRDYEWNDKSLIVDLSDLQPKDPEPTWLDYLLATMFITTFVAVAALVFVCVVFALLGL